MTSRGRGGRGRSTTQRKPPTDIEFIILADAARTVQGKVYILGGGFSVFTPPQYPADFQFSVAVGAVLDRTEANKQQVFRYFMGKPQHAPLMKAEGAFMATDGQSVSTLGIRSVLTFQTQVRIPDPGVYEVAVEIGDSRKTVQFEALPASAGTSPLQENPGTIETVNP